MTLEELNKLKNPDVLKIIKENEKESPDSFVLKNSQNKDLPARAIAEQIICRKKAKIKLPDFIGKELLFNSVSLEQCSGSAAAKFKSEILSGEKIFDMTGGLGIDDIYFSKGFSEVTYSEIETTIAETARYNFQKLNLNNIKVFNNDSTELINQFDDSYFDWIFIDPARRDENRRSIDLNFCVPNVYQLEDVLFKKSKNVCLKLAPAFDLSEAVRNFRTLKEFIVVSVDGECKEVLLILEKKYSSYVFVKSVTLKNNSEEKFIITEKINNKEIKKTNSVQKYFFEPDAAIIKAGLTSKLAVNVGLQFINLNVDYLTGNESIENFPGRSFWVVFYADYKPKDFKNYLKNNNISKANFSKRGFPHSVDELKKKYKIKDGGEEYFFFTEDLNNNLIFIHTRRLKTG